MLLGELLEEISEMTGASATDLDRRVRALRASGLLEDRGRGSGAGEIAARDVGRLVLALASPRCEDSGDFLASLLRQRPADGDATLLAEARSFGGAMDAIIGDPECAAAGVAELWIHADRPLIRVVADDGRERRFGYVDPAVARRRGWRSSPVEVWVRISGGILSALSLRLREDDDDAGWTGDAPA